MLSILTAWKWHTQLQLKTELFVLQMQWYEVAFNTEAASIFSLYPRYALYLLIQTHMWLSFITVVSEVKLIDINIFIVICQEWNRGKRLVPFRLLTLVWRQGSLLSRVNLLLLLYKVTGDVVADNNLVMEGMNRGFGSWSLLVVLLGKKRTNNLGIICSTPPPFSINYSFYRFPPEARQTSTGDSLARWHLIHTQDTK